MAETTLTRDQLAEFLPNPRAIKIFEQINVNAVAVPDIAASLSSHISSSAAHGTVGSVVGTTDTQTLTNKTMIAPDLGTPSTLVGTNITGLATALSIGGNAGTVTTNADLTGPITSVGNATSIASQTGTGSTFVVQTSPTITNPNIVGTTTNDNAAAGSVGEYVSATASGVVLTTAASANVTSISLTAGDWDVYATVNFNPSGGAIMTRQDGSVNDVSATLGGLGRTFSLRFTAVVNTGSTSTTPSVRLSLGTTTTVYAVAQGTFAAGACTADALIGARRAR